MLVKYWLHVQVFTTLSLASVIILPSFNTSKNSTIYKHVSKIASKTTSRTSLRWYLLELGATPGTKVASYAPNGLILLNALWAYSRIPPFLPSITLLEFVFVSRIHKVVRSMFLGNLDMFISHFTLLAGFNLYESP